MISRVGISQWAPEGSAATSVGVGISQPVSRVSAAISRSGENSMSMSGQLADAQRRSTSRCTVPERLSASSAWLMWEQSADERADHLDLAARTQAVLDPAQAWQRSAAPDESGEGHGTHPNGFRTVSGVILSIPGLSKRHVIGGVTIYLGSP